MIPSKVVRFAVLCAVLRVISPVAAQETMDEATLRQHIIMSEGKPPDSYVETRHVTMSNGRDYTKQTLHRALDYKSNDGTGRLEGRAWDQDADGWVTIHEPASGLERADLRKVSI